MIPTEAQARSHLRSQLSDHPIIIQSIETSTGTGVGDLYVWVFDPDTLHGRGWWLELKRGRKQLSVAQKRWFKKMSRAGVPCGVLRIWEDYWFELDYLDGYQPHSRFTARSLYDYLSAGLVDRREKDHMNIQ